MAAKYPLPRQFLVHGHWICDGSKMSKSKGNVISPFEAMSTWDADILRYYMIKEGGTDGDGTWSSASLTSRGLSVSRRWGNLVNRFVSPRWDVRSAVEMFSEQNGRGYHVRDHHDTDNLIGYSMQAVKRYEKAMNNLNFKGALEEVDSFWRLVRRSLNPLTIGKSVLY
jgi:methionyl-tRNA synthetase